MIGITKVSLPFLTEKLLYCKHEVHLNLALLTTGYYTIPLTKLIINLVC